MLIRADVKCYYCGHVSGQVEGDPDDPKTVWSYHPGSEPASRSIPRQNSIRCNRCGIACSVRQKQIRALRDREQIFIGLLQAGKNVFPQQEFGTVTRVPNFLEQLGAVTEFPNIRADGVKLDTFGFTFSR